MKRLLLTVVTGIFLAVFILGGCKADTSKAVIQDYHLVQLDSIRSQFNSKREQKDWAALTRGRAKLLVTDELVSILYTPASKEENVVYFLQGATKDYGLKTDSLGLIEELFLERNLIINCLEENKTLLFSVRDERIPTYLQGFAPTKQYTGYGLGARKINKDGASGNVPWCKCEALGSPDSNCTLGGDGTHACGSGTPDGSCEISCSQSTFACCDEHLAK